MMTDFPIFFPFRNVPVGDGIPVSRPLKDWDAPNFKDENPEAYEVPQGIKRKRRLIGKGNKNVFSNNQIFKNLVKW